MMWLHKRIEITIFLLLIKIFTSEARVYCQDKHALPWTSVGPPCTVTCRTILTAIEKLKQIDYEYLFDEDIRNKIKMTLPEINNMSLHLLQPVISRKTKNSQEIYYIPDKNPNESAINFKKEPLFLAGGYNNSRQMSLSNFYSKKELPEESNLEEQFKISNKNFEEHAYLEKQLLNMAAKVEHSRKSLSKNVHLKRELSNSPEEPETSRASLSKNVNFKKDFLNMAGGFKNTREKLSEKEYLKKELLKMAGELKNGYHRRHSRTTLLGKFVMFLNKYAQANYTFDDDFASALVDKFENELNLRFGESTFKNLFMYLIEAMSGLKTKQNLVIRLKSTNCIPVYVPGCFCEQGYVEYNGKCVLPSECLLDKTFSSYLERIFI